MLAEEKTMFNCNEITVTEKHLFDYPEEEGLV